MRNLFLFAVIIMLASFGNCFAQDNTFPSSGNVGIGTGVSNAQVPLHIKSSTDAAMYLERTGGSKYYIASQSGNYFQIGLSGGGVAKSFVLNDGKMGIGTTTPDATLTVKGTIHTREVLIDLDGMVAPDYVFDKAYKLPSLETIKYYIGRHHHLPEVPSAKQMEENGINLGEMNLLLLKKIEELTLYVIKLNDQVDSLRVEIKQVKKGG